MGLGHLGVPWGWVSWGVRRWGCGLACMGIGDSWVSCFSGGCMRRCWDACAGGRRLPAWRPYCSGVGPGGAWGSGGALPPGWGLRLGLGGLGPGWCAAGSMGLVHALGPGSGVGGLRCIVPPQGVGGVQ